MLTNHREVLMMRSPFGRSIGLFDHLIRLRQQRWRDREAKRLRGLGIDYQIELCWLFDGDVPRSRASKDSVDVDDT